MNPWRSCNKWILFNSGIIHAIRKSMTVNTRWLGTAGVELTHKDKVILIDPYLSRLDKRDIFFKPLLPRKDRIRWYLQSIRGSVSAVIVGHTHFDHALDIPEVAANLDCPVLGGNSLDAYLHISGLPGKTSICQPQEQIALNAGITLTMIPSLHGLIMRRLLLLEGNIRREWQLPLRTHRFRLGEMYAPKISFGGVTFLHMGSAGFLEKELDGHQCDVLFLCVPGWKKSPGYPERVIEIVKPSCVVPFHYDDFTFPLMPGWKYPVMKSADLRGFIGRLKMIRPDLEIRLLDPFMSSSF
jgi:L-ascorbate metabolism protein UlaG (beta-lactamase superfamily)